MTDWQISQSDDFTELPPEALPSVWRRRGWGVLAAALMLGLALAAFWQQRREGQVALAEDLKAAIFAEEMSRFLGRPEAAFYQAEAPAPWRKAYRLSFQREAVGKAGSRELPAVSLASIDSFDGQCALITLTNSSHDPVRA